VRYLYNAHTICLSTRDSRSNAELDCQVFFKVLTVDSAEPVTQRIIWFDSMKKQENVQKNRCPGCKIAEYSSEEFVAKIHKVASIFATITTLFLHIMLLKTSHIYM